MKGPSVSASGCYRLMPFFFWLFDRLLVRISSLHHRILRTKIYQIRAYDFGVQFSFNEIGAMTNEYTLEQYTTGTDWSGAEGTHLTSIQSLLWVRMDEMGAQLMQRLGKAGLEWHAWRARIDLPLWYTSGQLLFDTCHKAMGGSLEKGITWTTQFVQPVLFLVKREERKEKEKKVDRWGLEPAAAAPCQPDCLDVLFLECLIKVASEENTHSAGYRDLWYSHKSA